jgi:phenylacetate-CoA ligase
MNQPLAPMRSHLTGVAWPAMPSLRGAQVMSLLFQLQHTQWWEPGRLVEYQLGQLAELLRHAYDSVPFYRHRFDAAGFRPAHDLTLEAWESLPLLTRREVQDAGPALISRSIPPQFGEFTEIATSGSTGEPVKMLCTQFDQLMWEAMTMREHQWHRRDLTGKLASVRVFPKGFADPPHGTALNDWGQPPAELYVTGPCVALNIAADIGTQARWLMLHEPDYLLSYPTNLAALIRHFAARGERLRRLREVTTVGETVTPALRASCRQILGAPLVDIYSSREFGTIALQCPENGHYHVMSESAFVEVIGRDGKPCAPGHVGRLVISKLHSFAMPLIRYELRDFAEVGPPCSCGRGLPTLARILGRGRNMLTFPTGEQVWPVVGFDAYREIAPVRQFQLVQHTREEIEVRFVVDRALTAREEARLEQVIQGALGFPFRLRFVYFGNEIPRGPGGKFEEFISLLDPAP